MIRGIVAGILLAVLVMFNAGCALLGAAASAGIGYAIYQAMNK
jgi:hypothetical protein